MSSVCAVLIALALLSVGCGSGIHDKGLSEEQLIENACKRAGGVQQITADNYNGDTVNLFVTCKNGRVVEVPDQ